MIDADFIGELEAGAISRDEAILECIHAYRTAWSQIGLIREVLEQLGEASVVAELNDSLDRLTGAMDGSFADLYSIDMDGNIHVRPSSAA